LHDENFRYLKFSNFLSKRHIQKKTEMVGQKNPQHQWSRTYRLAVWLSLLLFFVGFIFFFVSYVGNDWYVVPVDGMVYPPEAQSVPVKLGLFWMCAYGHCKYDLRVDYMVVQHIPYKTVQDSYQNYRTACMVIITIAAVAVLLALALNLVFLSRYSCSWCLGDSNYSFSGFAGIAAGAVEILAGIIALIGIALFGNKFRGPTLQLPFGWSYWLMLVAIIVLFVDGVITILLALSIIYKNRQAANPNNKSLTRPLASGY